MTDEADIYAPKETDPQGLMSADYMERLRAAWMQGLFFWNDDYTALVYRNLPK